MSLARWNPFNELEEMNTRLNRIFGHSMAPRTTGDGGILRLEGERKHEKEDKGKKYHRIERSYGSFLRTFTLPDNVDDTKVRAEFKDGVLNVRLPKTERAKPAIEVKVA